MAEDIWNILNEQSNLHTSLHLFCKHLTSLGVRDLMYGYMLRPNSYVRSDVVFSSTMDIRIMKQYALHGGFSSDPVAETGATRTQPTFFSVKKIYNDPKAGKFYRHKFAKVLLDNGYDQYWTCPFIETEHMGFGTLSFFQNHNNTKSILDGDELSLLAQKFHRIIIETRQIASFFNLSDKEINILARCTEGRNIDDIAHDTNTSQRTVERHLKSARDKLKARTTPEAVYKATAYNILPGRRLPKNSGKS